MSEAALPARPAVLRLEWPAVARALALLLPLGLLSGALGSQYFGGLNPCEMCYWQRWPHAFAIALAGLAFTSPAASRPSRTFVLMAAAAIAASGGIGVYHAGVELGVFDGFTTCAINAAGGSTDDLFKQIMGAPLIRCDQVQWSFLGLSMASWNALLSLGGAALVTYLAFRRPRA
jgi:disulfide bond formation protein DsbB